MLGRWVAWWAVVTLFLWGVTLLMSGPESFADCARGAAVIIVVGECVDRLRRRRLKRRAATTGR